MVGPCFQILHILQLIHFYTLKDEKAVSVILSPGDGEMEGDRGVHFFLSFSLFFFSNLIKSHKPETGWVECG